MKTLVIGLGISGQAMVDLLRSQGKEVVGVDRNEELVARLSAEKGIETFVESHPLSFEGIGQVVLSSGVRPTHPLCALARERGIETVGEAEWSLRHAKQPCMAITGTNGKTTVTLLVEHLLKESGIKARALGNIGDPLAAYFIAPDPEEVLVIELSSYQLETLQTPVFDAGIILNITPDHLDRYESMWEYASAKCRLQQGIKPGAPFYVHHRAALEFGGLLQRRAIKTFGAHEGAFLWTDKIYARLRENIAYFLPLSYRELGIHESENALAAFALVSEFGVSREAFQSGLESFKKPPHRIEFVKNVEGVSYYDDSKGTNLDAVVQAVGAMEGPVILIAGGVDKGASYAPWIASFQSKVKRILALGEAAPKLVSDLSPAYPVETVSSLEEAVIRAARHAEKGDCVLLSPGCASFDMFRDYAHRGEVFKRQVDNLR